MNSKAPKKINRLKIVLAELGMSNKEFAKRWGKTEQTVSRIVNNKKQFHMSSLYEISKLTGVAMDKFIVAEVAK